MGSGRFRTDKEGEMTEPTIVVVCTLTADDLALQRNRWHDVASRAFAARIETEQGLRLEFRARSGVATELEDLLAVERRCCAWADWRLERAGDRLVVDVRSTADGVPALHSMFSSLGA
jgi:hypothetical protein